MKLNSNERMWITYALDYLKRQYKFNKDDQEEIRQLYNKIVREE